MSKREQFYLCLVAVCAGMLLVVCWHTMLLYFEWAMLALGGNLR